MCCVLSIICLPLFIGGCKSDVHHQLLERELRLQEDQIYCLQDKLQTQCYELDTMVDENTSLRKQLGIVDTSSSPLNKVQSPTPTQPLLVPPQVDVQDFNSGNNSDTTGPIFGTNPQSSSGGQKKLRQSSESYQ